MSTSLISSILPLLKSCIGNNDFNINTGTLLSKLPSDTLKSIYKDSPQVVFSALAGVLSDDRFNPIKSIVEMLLHSFIETQDQEKLVYVSIANLLQEFKKGNISSRDVEMCIYALVKASEKFDGLGSLLRSVDIIKHLHGLFSMYDGGEFYKEFITMYAYKNVNFVAKGMVSGDIVFTKDILAELPTNFFCFIFSDHPIDKIPKPIIAQVLSDPIILKEVIRANPEMKNIAVKHAYEKNDYTSVLWSMDIDTIHNTFTSLGLSYEGTIIHDILQMDYEGYVPALSVLSAFVKNDNLALLYAIKDSFASPEEGKGFDPSYLKDLINNTL